MTPIHLLRPAVLINLSRAKECDLAIHDLEKAPPDRTTDVMRKEGKLRVGVDRLQFYVGDKGPLLCKEELWFNQVEELERRLIWPEKGYQNEALTFFIFLQNPTQ